MLWKVSIVFVTIMCLACSTEGFNPLPRGSSAWGYFTPPVLQRVPQQTPLEEMVELTNDLAVAILQDHSFSRGNFAFSPYGAASVLVVLYEGARGESARQIHRAIGFPSDKDVIRIGFRDIHRHLRSYFSHEGYLSGISLNRRDSSLKPEYKKILRFYGYDIEFNHAQEDEEGGVSEPVKTTASVSPSESTPSAKEPFINERVTESTMMTTSAAVTEKNVETTNVDKTTLVFSTTVTETTEREDLEIQTTTEYNSNCSLINKGKQGDCGSVTETTTEKQNEDGETLLGSTDLPVTEPKPTESVKVEEITDVNLDNGMLIPQPDDAKVLTTEKSPPQTTLAEMTSIMTSTLSTETTTLDSYKEEKKVETTTLESYKEEKKVETTTLESYKEEKKVETTTLDSYKEEIKVETTTLDSYEKEKKVETTTLDSYEEEQQVETSTLDSYEEEKQLELAGTMISSKNEIKMMKNLTKMEQQRVKNIRNMFGRKSLSWLTGAPRKSNFRRTRTITDYLKVPHSPQLSLQLQNGMYDTHISRNANLYRSLPRLLFLVDGAIDTPVPMMTYSSVFSYAYIPRLHSKAMEFPLDDNRYKLLILLPVERRGLRQLIYDLSGVPLSNVLKALQPQRVKVMVPTFMVEGFVILTSSLQKLGIWDVFDPRKANLSGMSMDPELYVRNVEQSVTVVIRNYVEILDIQTRTMAARHMDQEFEATHPFLYFVMDTATNVALMAGQILDPLNSRIY